MRRVLLKMMNLVYMIGCALALIGIFTKPMLNLSFTGKFSSEDVATFVTKSLGSDRDQNKKITGIQEVTVPEKVNQNKYLNPSDVTVVIVYEDETTQSTHPDEVNLNTSVIAPDVVGNVKVESFSKDFHVAIVAEGGAGSDSKSTNLAAKVTKQRVKEAFPNGLTFTVALKIKNTYAFELTNKNLSSKMLDENIYAAIDDLLAKITPPLHNLVKEITSDYAKDTLKEQVNAEIAKYFEGEGAQVTDEQVSDLFDSIYEQIDGQSTTIEELANAIIGKDSEGKKIEGVTSLVSIMDEIYAKAQDPDDPSVSGGSGYNPDSITGDNVADKLAQALSSVPGLIDTSYEVCNPQPSQAQVEAAVVSEDRPNYYVCDEHGNFSRATEWSPDATYYNIIQIVNDVETALASMISSLVEQSGSKAPSYRVTRASQDEEKASEKELREALKTFIEKQIKLDSIKAVLATADPYLPYALLGVMAFFALPFVFFFLVTLIRTFGRRKIWANAGAIVIFTLLHLVLGLVLTYGLKFFLPVLEPLLSKFLPAQFLSLFTIGISTGCLWASFVVAGYIVMFIPYLIIAHPFKVIYKQEKRFRRYDFPPYDDRRYNY